MAKGGKRVFVILLKRKQRFAVVGFPLLVLHLYSTNRAKRDKQYVTQLITQDTGEVKKIGIHDALQLNS